MFPRTSEGATIQRVTIRWSLLANRSVGGLKKSPHHHRRHFAWTPRALPSCFIFVHIKPAKLAKLNSNSFTSHLKYNQISIHNLLTVTNHAKMSLPEANRKYFE